MLVSNDEVDAKWQALVTALQSPDGLLRTHSQVHTLACGRFRRSSDDQPPTWIIKAYVSNAFSSASAEDLPRLFREQLATSPNALIPDIYDLLEVDEQRSLYLGQTVIGDRGLPVFNDTVLPRELNMAGMGEQSTWDPKTKVEGLDDKAITFAQDPAVVDLDWLIDPADKVQQPIVLEEGAEGSGAKTQAEHTTVDVAGEGGLQAPGQVTGAEVSNGEPNQDVEQVAQ